MVYIDVELVLGFANAQDVIVPRPRVHIPSMARSCDRPRLRYLYAVRFVRRSKPIDVSDTVPSFSCSVIRHRASHVTKSSAICSLQNIDIIPGLRHCSTTCRSSNTHVHTNHYRFEFQDRQYITCARGTCASHPKAGATAPSTPCEGNLDIRCRHGGARD
jgi:hypothetical protein